jgi:PKD repeat protein
VITRTWRATDVSGNYSECVQRITVQDITAPVVNCKPVTIQLVNGQANITASMVNNNSADQCSPVTLSVSKTTFTCNDLGKNFVTLTVKDASGNQSTCQAVVDVVGDIPSCSITAIPESGVFTGGIPTNIYLGYGSQSTTLSVTATGGAPYTYSWTGNGTLSNTNTANPVFTPTTPGYYTFTVVVTNKNGCKTTCSISFCVNDIRVPGTNGRKVYVCHITPSGQSNTLEIAVEAVAAHIGPGGHGSDRLGKCDMQVCGVTYTTKTEGPAKVKESFDAVASPNPTTNYFTLKITGTISDKPVKIRVTDLLGRTVETFERNPGEELRFGQKYFHGVYIVEVVQGTNKKQIKLIKAN